MHTVMEQLRPRHSHKEENIPLLCLTLRLRNGEIVVDHLGTMRGPAPAGQIAADEEVPGSVIGHWLEITAKCGKVLYRRYVQRSLPINMENAESKLRKIYALEKYRVVVPELPEAHQLALYEQSLSEPVNRTPIKKERLKLDLPTFR